MRGSVWKKKGGQSNGKQESDDDCRCPQPPFPPFNPPKVRAEGRGLCIPRLAHGFCFAKSQSSPIGVPSLHFHSRRQTGFWQRYSVPPSFKVMFPNFSVHCPKPRGTKTALLGIASTKSGRSLGRIASGRIARDSYPRLFLRNLSIARCSQRERSPVHS